MTALSVVVPSTTASARCRPSRRVDAVLDGLDYEVVLVNDGSRDSELGGHRDARRADPWVRGLDLMRNYGQHNALLAGIRAARLRPSSPSTTTSEPAGGDPEAARGARRGADVVYGSAASTSTRLLRDAASRVTKLALRSVDRQRRRAARSAPSAPSARPPRAFDDYRGPFVSIDVLLTWGARRFASVTVAHDARAAGASNYTFGRLARTPSTS